MNEPTGYTALDLIGFTDKKAYNPATSYVKNDLVHYGGNIWRVLIDDTIGQTPQEGVYYTLYIGEPTNLVERIMAPLEENPATQAWTVKRQFIYNDYLYEVIRPIAANDALIAYEDDPTNANIKLAPPIETQLLDIKAEADATDNMIAPVETNPATSSHSVGSQIIFDNVLYDVTTAIFATDALVAYPTTGYNIKPAATVTSQIQALTNKCDEEFMRDSTINYFGSIKGQWAQGVAVDNDGIIYMIMKSSSTGANIKKYSFTGGYIGESPEITVYHGNDMTIIGDNLYIATLEDANQNLYTNKDIVVVNKNTWATTVISPFGSEVSGGILAIAKEDDAHLICAFTTSQNFSNIKLYRLNINDLTYEALTISNPQNLITNFYSMLQSSEYYDGKFYILVNGANGLFEFTIADNNAILTHTIGLPSNASNGIPLGEIEGISLLPSAYGGTFLVHCGVAWGTYTDIHLGLLNLYDNLPISIVNDIRIVASQTPSKIYVDNSYTDLWEDGSSAHPYKRVMNGIIVNQTDFMFQKAGAVNIKNGSYILPAAINNKRIYLVPVASTDRVTFVNSESVTFENCDVTLNGRFWASSANEDSKEFIFTGPVVFNACNVRIINTSFRDIVTCGLGTNFNGNSLYTHGLITLQNATGFIEIVGTVVDVNDPLVRVEYSGFLKISGSVLTTSRVSLAGSGTLAPQGTLATV